MKKVLITGAGGFIGSHLVERLVREGHDITALVHYNSSNSWGWLESLDSHLKKSIQIVSGDVRDFSNLLSLTKDKHQIFHLAALIGIPYSYAAPSSYVETNVTGTLNVLEAAKMNDIQRVILTSTSEVYGTAQYVPMDEKHPLNAQSPYAATKIAADQLGLSYHKSFGLPVTVVRPFNTFGPRQSVRAVIPTIISQLVSGSDTITLGNLDSKRDFNYVKDTVNGFVEISKSHRTIGEVVNISTESEVSIGEIAERLIQVVNPKARIVIDHNRLRPKASEVDRLFGSGFKIRELTEWRQIYTLDQGLVETVRFFEKNNHLFKFDQYNV